MDSPLQARPLFDTFSEAVAMRGLRYGEKQIAPLLDSVYAGTALGELATAREMLSVCYAIAGHLKLRDRNRQTLLIQCAHLRWAVAAGDMRGAATLSSKALDLSPGPAGLSPEELDFCIEASQVLRRLGLHKLTLALLEQVQQGMSRLPDNAATEGLVSVLLNRIHILSQHAGRSFRKQGPLGWESWEASAAQAALAQALAELRSVTLRAEQAGLVSFALAGRQILQAHEHEPAKRPAALLAFVLERARTLKLRGFVSDEFECLLDTAGMQIDNGLFDSASVTLRQAASLRQPDAMAMPAAERWHWFTFLCLQQQGRLDGALQAHTGYADAVSKRTELAQQVLQEHLQNGNTGWLSASACRKQAGTTAGRDQNGVTPHTAPSADGFEQSLAALSQSAHSVVELAAGLDLSVRRLQQIFKQRGLPAPAQYLRKQLASRGARPGQAGARG